MVCIADTGRLPVDEDRISRHYYDVAMIMATEVRHSVIVDTQLLHAIRNRNPVALRQAGARFEEAVPRSLRLVPQAELRTVVERDYRAMHGMILGEAPDFGWVTGQLRAAEARVS